MLAVSSVCVAAIVASIFLGDVPDFTDPQAVRSLFSEDITLWVVRSDQSVLLGDAGPEQSRNENSDFVTLLFRYCDTIVPLLFSFRLCSPS